jgi:hypothetical protein
MGELIDTIPAARGYLRDDETVVRVRLEHEDMSLQSIEDALLLAGGNAAMLGDELIQFGRAVLESGGEDEGRVWRLSRLLRCRGGELPQAGHGAGAPFVLLDDAALLALPQSLALRTAAGGATIQWAERGSDEFESEAVPATAAALKPLSPVHGRSGFMDNGDLHVSWVRRSRLNAGWRDEVDLPVGEAAEQYLITVVEAMSGEAVATFGPWTSRESEWTVPADVWAAIGAGRAFEIRQQGDFALSAPLRIVPTA